MTFLFIVLFLRLGVKSRAPPPWLEAKPCFGFVLMICDSVRHGVTPLPRYLKRSVPGCFRAAFKTGIFYMQNTVTLQLDTIAELEALPDIKRISAKRIIRHMRILKAASLDTVAELEALPGAKRISATRISYYLQNLNFNNSTRLPR